MKLLNESMHWTNNFLEEINVKRHLLDEAFEDINEEYGEKHIQIEPSWWLDDFVSRKRINNSNWIGVGVVLWLPASIRIQKLKVRSEPNQTVPVRIPSAWTRTFVCD